MAKLVDLRQILLSPRIIDAIQTIISPEKDLTSYTMSKLPAGFGLNRFDSIMEMSAESFNELLHKEPIQVKKAVNPTGQGLGVKVDGRLLQGYELMDGRHRVARAIAEDKTQIEIIIQ
jgi:hypothetical protein